MEWATHPLVAVLVGLVGGAVAGVFAYASKSYRERHVERKIAALLDHQETGYMPRATVNAAFETLNSRLDRWESRMERLESRLGKTLFLDSPRLLDHMTSVSGRVQLIDGALGDLVKMVNDRLDGIERRLASGPPHIER